MFNIVKLTIILEDLISRRYLKLLLNSIIINRKEYEVKKF